MTRSFWKLLAVTALVAWCFSGAPRARADDAASISLEEITRRVTEWRSSFVNVRVVWELRSLPETDKALDEWPPPLDPDGARLFGRREWIWADHGLDLLEDWFFFHEDGSSKVHSINAFNGPKRVVFSANFRKPAADVPEQYLGRQLFDLGVGKPISSISRDAVEGLYWPGFAEWLPEVLSKWEWKLEAVEDIHGQPCARIAARRDETADLAWFEVLWLDLDHDCLVRRHRARSLAGQFVQGGRDFVVDEFQRLDEGIWFPKRCRSQLGGTRHENHLIVVTEVAVNESVDLARFDPPPPREVTVASDNAADGRSGGSVNGVSAAAQPESAAANTNMALRRSAERRTPSWLWWSAALASVSVVFLGAGFWLSRHRQENRP